MTSMLCLSINDSSAETLDLDNPLKLFGNTHIADDSARGKEEGEVDLSSVEGCSSYHRISSAFDESSTLSVTFASLCELSCHLLHSDTERMINFMVDSRVITSVLSLLYHPVSSLSVSILRFIDFFFYNSINVISLLKQIISCFRCEPHSIA
jgi:hypothetical protein